MLATSKDDIKKGAARDLALKLKLEKGFKRELKTFFNMIRKDFESNFVADGNNIDLMNYQDDLKVVLKKQYRRTVEAFSKNMRASLKELEGKQTEEELNAQVAADLLILMRLRADRQSRFILETTASSIDAAVAEVVSESIVNGENLTAAQLANRADTLLKKRFDGRINTIAITETSSMAEDSKALEAASVVAAGLVEGPIVKQWDAVLDERTRINHAVADGQRREIGEPFVVGGQLLQNPGDTSLGATLDNVINCRCSTQYVVGTPTVL